MSLLQSILSIIFPQQQPQSNEDKEQEEWMAKIKENGSNLRHAPDHIRGNKQVLLAAIQEECGQDNNNDGWEALEFASIELKNDREVVSAFVHENGWAIQFASPQLRNDKTLVLAAVENSGGLVLRNVSSLELLNDVEFMNQAVQYHGWVLQYAPPGLKNDKEFVIKAVQKHGGALRFASKDMKNNKDVVLVAVQKSGYALQHTTPNLRNDKDVVLAAVQKDGNALKFASPSLRNDEDVVFVAVQEDGLALQHANPNTRNNPRIVMAAVQRNGRVLQYATSEVRSNKEIVITAVRRNGLALEYVPNNLRKDKDVVLAAIRCNPDSIKYAHDDIKRDPEVLIAVGMFDENYYHHDDDNNNILLLRQSRQPATTTSTTNNNNGNNNNNNKIKKKVALSTRFSLDPNSESQATDFTKLFKEHGYISGGNFKVFAPNAFNKQTCDPNWTDFDWPCRGTNDTCQYDNVLTTAGQPTNHCCWRYSFRYQLEEAKATGGFMLQLVEKDKWDSDQPNLGKGQLIEQDMAQQLNLKMFHVYRPTNEYGWEYNFEKHHIDEIVTAIQNWYDDNDDSSRCQQQHDDAECVVIRPKGQLCVPGVIIKEQTNS